MNKCLKPNQSMVSNAPKMKHHHKGDHFTGWHAWFSFWGISEHVIWIFQRKYAVIRDKVCVVIGGYLQGLTPIDALTWDK